MSPDPRARFAEFEMDLETAELYRSESADGRQPVHLPPQAARLLALLVSRAGRLIERETIRDELWGDRWVDWEAGLHQSVRRVRKALGDDEVPRRFVETVARRGYRFIAAVDSGEPRAASPRARAGGHLSIAIATALALTAAGWVVGSRAPSGDGRADGPSHEAQAQAESGSAEARRLYAEALHLASQAEAAPALRRLELAADRDPSWSAPWSAIAEMRLDSADDNRVEEARRAIERALVREAGDARAWRALARLRLWEEWDWLGARGALERALRLEPADADGWQLLAALETVTGREAAALAAATRAVELDPVSTVRRADLGWTLYYFGRHEEAAAECLRGLEIDPGSATAERCLMQSRLLTARRQGQPPPAGLVDELGQGRGALEDQPSCATEAAFALPQLLRGDSSGAVESLLAAARQGRGWELPFAVVDPLLAPLGADPRLAEARAALGLPEPRATG